MRNDLPGPWIEITSGRNSEGKCAYNLHWLADYHPGHPEGEHRLGIRSQGYFADPIKNGHAEYPKWDGGVAAKAAIAKAGE